MMPHQVRTNTKLAIILNRYRGDEFTAQWKGKAKAVSKHTQRFRIMWERMNEGDATLPLFDNDYEPADNIELFAPVPVPTANECIEQTNECIKNKHDKKAPTILELKQAFWAEELRENKKSKYKGTIYE